jgi:Flp pilus assembly pilin Flp
MNNLPGLIPAAAVGVGLAAALVDIAAIAAVQALNSSVTTALAGIGGSLC